MPLRIAQSHCTRRTACREGSATMSAVSRREFLQCSALVIGFSLAPGAAFSQTARLPGSLNNNRSLDAWLRIGADGAITLLTGKVEIGQGIGTALMQIAADELDVDF